MDLNKSKYQGSRNAEFSVIKMNFKCKVIHLPMCNVTSLTPTYIFVATLYRVMQMFHKVTRSITVNYIKLVHTNVIQFA